MSDQDQPYRVVPAPRVHRDIQRLPERVAAACIEFIQGGIARNPHRFRKRLLGPFAGCHAARRGSYRIVYRIDDEHRVVEILHIDHRSDVYRP